MKRHTLTMLSLAAGMLLLAQSALAQSEQATSGGGPDKLAGAKRVIAPGDVLKITAYAGPGPVEGIEYAVGDDGKLSGQTQTTLIGVAVSGLTERQAVEAILGSFRAMGHGEEWNVEVAFLRHVDKAEGAVGLIVNPQLVTLDLQTAVSLSKPSRFLDKAAVAAGLDPNRCVLEITPIVYSGDQVVGRGAASGASISVHVEAKVTNGSRQDAQALVRAACEEVAAAFRAWGREATRPLLDQLRDLDLRRRGSEAELLDMLDQLRKLMGDYASVGEYLKAVQTASAEVDALRLTMESETARRNKLEKMAAVIRGKMEAAAKADPISVELERVIDLRKQVVQRVEVFLKNGADADEKLRDAQEKLALARVELLRRREEVGRSAGGELLAQFAQQMLAAELAASDATVRYEAIATRLAMLKANQKPKTIEDRQRHIAELEGTISGDQREIDNLRRLLAVPSVQATPTILPDAGRPKAPATQPAK